MANEHTQINSRLSYIALLWNNLKILSPIFLINSRFTNLCESAKYSSIVPNYTIEREFILSYTTSISISLNKGTLTPVALNIFAR